MITFRDRNTRGHTRTGWLDSRHSFSFGGYRDPGQMGFRNLRVLNQDVVIPGAGFAPHEHTRMDILTWVTRGALRHEDSTGVGAVIPTGVLQRMSAASGVWHSEVNASTEDAVEFVQVWLIPEDELDTPIYEAAEFADETLRDRLVLAAGREGAPVGLASSTRLRIGRLSEGARLRHELAAGEAAWLQVVSGLIGFNGWEMREGDGAAIADETWLDMEAEADAEVMLFEFPAPAPAAG